MSRKESREKFFIGEKNEISLENVLSEIKEESEKKYVSDVYIGISDKFEVLSNEIAQKANGFSLERIFKVDLAIMMVAVFEMKYYNIPSAVAINEAVDIAKKYSTEKSANFVNGVLAGFVVKK